MAMAVRRGDLGLTAQSGFYSAQGATKRIGKHQHAAEEGSDPICELAGLTGSKVTGGVQGRLEELVDGIDDNFTSLRELIIGNLLGDEQSGDKRYCENQDDQDQSAYGVPVIITGSLIRVPVHEA